MQTISYNTAHGEKSIQCRGAKLWNGVVEEIRNSASFNIFKKHYKAHLIENDPNDDGDFLFY